MMSLEILNSALPSPLHYNKAATRKLARKKYCPYPFFVLVLSGQIISKVIYRQNCPWPGLLTIVSRVDYQRGGVGTEGRMGKPSKNA